MIGIYKITSPSGKIYIGQAINILKRWKQYGKLNCKNQPKLYNSLKKYGFDVHVFEIIEECPIERLDELETWWKFYYGFKCVEDGLCCNYWDNQPLRGRKRSKETCLKMSNSMKGKNNGKKFSEEVKKKISESKKGFKHSKETLHKMSISRLGVKDSEETKNLKSKIKKGNKINLGRKHSEEARLKMSKSQKGKMKKKGRKLSEEHKRKLSESIKISKSKYKIYE